MKSISDKIEKLKDWLIAHQNDIILFLIIVLISSLSFTVGFIVGRETGKEPIKILFIYFPSKTKEKDSMGNNLSM